VSPDDRRPFQGAPYDRNRNDRPAGPGADRGDRPHMDRPGFAPQRPFVRPPTRGGDMAPPEHVVRLRDGDREIEVSGNPAFVRQVLDDLPALMARLRGEAGGRTTISMPAPPAPVATSPDSTAAVVGDELASAATVVADRPGGVARGSRNGARKELRGDVASASNLEERVFGVLRSSDRPLAIAAIRQRLDGPEATGQQVRRLLERAGPRVTVSADRPATYSLR
jgi:hypothetical protein